MKSYLLSQNAADFLKGRMAGQSAQNPPPGDAANGVRVSGAFQPFEIISDWTKADGENAYSCRGAMIIFDGKDFIKEEDGFQFPLYSPLDLNEKPSCAPGDKCFAVLRGGRWEVSGGGGGESNPLRISKLSSTLVAGGSARTEAGDLVYGRTLMPGRAVSERTTVTYLKDSDGRYSVVDFTRYSDRLALPVPLVVAGTTSRRLGVRSSYTIAEEFPLGVLSRKFYFPSTNIGTWQNEGDFSGPYNGTPLDISSIYPATIWFKFHVDGFQDGPMTTPYFIIGETPDDELVKTSVPASTPAYEVILTMDWLDNLPVTNAGVKAILKKRYAIESTWTANTQTAAPTAATAGTDGGDVTVTVPANTSANRQLWTRVRLLSELTGTTVAGRTPYISRGIFSRP